jgi:Spy/CpxP family protein refolding chaperone
MVRGALGVVVAVLAVGTVAIGVSYAQPPAQERGRGAILGRGVMRAGPLGTMRRGLAQLGLSDEQKQQIKTIVQSRRADVQSFRQQLRQARRGVADAIANDADEAAIRARSAELAKVQADLAVFLAEIRKQVAGVLTPEQKTKAKELRLEARRRFDRF